MTDAAHIQLRLYAGLQEYEPPAADRCAITPGTTVGELLSRLKVPPGKAHLVFINGVKAGLDTPLQGGERVGIFPPVGGG